MALMLTKGFRDYIAHYREMGVAAMAPTLRERAFATIDADLREALGLPALPYPDLLTSIDGPSKISYIALKDTDLEGPLTWQEELTVQHAAEFERDREQIEADFVTSQALEPSLHRVVDADDDTAVEQLEGLTQGIGYLLKDYFESCEQSGLDPRTAMPSAGQIAEDLYQAALRLGLPVPNSSGSISNPGTPAQSKELFSDFAQKYLDLRCQGYTLKREDEAPHAATGLAFQRTSLRNWQSSVRVFTGIVGDLPLANISKTEINEFNSMIARLPANFGKSARDTRSSRQVIEDADESEPQAIAELTAQLRAKGRPEAEIEDALMAAKIKRISATTIKRHQIALQSILEHAVKSRLITNNPMKGRILSEADVKRWKRTEARIERTGWGDHIYGLLGSEIFVNPLKDVGDPLYWAPLIAMFAGLRLEETCQLRVRDFGKDGDILFVAVQNEIGSQLVKTHNSFRRIPLHRALIQVGLPRLVDYRRQQGMSRLFPEMPRSKSKGTMSAIMSKRFGYYIRSRGIKEEGLDFHALRTEFQVRLTRAKVPDHVRKGLMGHEQTDVTHANYYRAGETMHDLEEYVNRIDIDYSGILPAFGEIRKREMPALRIVS
ncbi:site-specific integrase [Paracoccus sp. AK26]|uniref:site-specific integrase n=1 Tax=Paracoccus sp. AK26 TaxID=2589076 RepID=UPI001AEDF655|nr:site-specific integrase [Paracoccus sp. AK26]